MGPGLGVGVDTAEQVAEVGTGEVGCGDGVVEVLSFLHVTCFTN